LDSSIGSHGEYTDQTFKEVHLDDEQLVSSEFYDCTFLRCSFAGCTLRACRFVNCTFRQCDLSLIQVPESAFSGTRFEDSKVVGVDWTQADWAAVGLGDPIGFSRCVISHSTFISLSLKKLQVRDCVATDVDFREADLTKADFAGTDLSESLFSSTNLTEADLSSARNYHIPPGQNILKQAKFSLPEAMALLYGMDIILIDQDTPD
jgi:fluoroquinolone resistance protein